MSNDQILEDFIDLRTVKTPKQRYLFKMDVVENNIVITILDGDYYGIQYSYVDLINVDGEFKFNTNFLSYGNNPENKFTISAELQHIIDKIFIFILTEFYTLKNETINTSN